MRDTIIISLPFLFSVVALVFFYKLFKKFFIKRNDIFYPKTLASVLSILLGILIFFIVGFFVIISTGGFGR